MKLTAFIAIPVTAMLGLAAAGTAQTPAPNGATLFASRCASCHVAPAGAKTRMAPSLARITGRKAGKVAGFNYSPAMKSSKLVWTSANLNTFLQRPTAMVPGTARLSRGTAVLRAFDPATVVVQS